MTKRLYLADPIKVMYMIKEFLVKFEIPVQILSTIDLKSGKTKIEHECIEIHDVIDYFDDSITDVIEGDLRVFVAEESESIFKPKEGDFVSNFLIKGNENRYCHGFLAKQSKILNADSLTVLTPERHNGKCYFVEDESQLTIIMRDGKHFFQAEAENE